MNVPFSYASPTLSVEALKHSIAYKLMFIIGKDPAIANKHEWLNATLFAVRDRMVERWLRSNRAQLSQEVRQVYYLSMEFLIGRTLSNALLSLGIYDDVSSALAEMGLDLEELIDEEYLDEKGRLQLGKAGLLAYSHGEYLTLGDSLGTFGWSVRKASVSRKNKKNAEKKPVSKKNKKSTGKKAVLGKRKK